MKVSQIPEYQSQYLKAADLPKPVMVTVEAVHFESLYNPSSGKHNERLLLSFQGKRKKLILNKTRARQMVEIAGDETDDWVGVGWSRPSLEGRIRLSLSRCRPASRRRKLSR